MIDVYLTNQTSFVPLVINWVFALLRFSIAPNEQILVRNFNLAAVSDEINSKFVLVSIALDPDPANNATITLN